MTLEYLLRRLDEGESLGTVQYTLAEDLIRAAWREAYEAGKRDGRLAMVNVLQDVGDDE